MALVSLLESCGETMEAWQVSSAGTLVGEQVRRLEELMTGLGTGDAMKTDFDQIKRTTDIVRVVESYGVKLKKVGRNHVGRCCFHADKNPSLIVTADKGLFHCPACGAAGNVIQFVARKEGMRRARSGVETFGRRARRHHRGASRSTTGHHSGSAATLAG